MEKETIIKFSIADGEISCLKSGNGENLVIALHGFAQTGANFDAISKIWGANCIIYAPDLPFHGETRWNNNNFNPKHIQELILAILQKEKYTSYHLLGFSLGGRIILSSLLQLSPLPTSIALIAPDGIATKRMFLPRVIPNFIKKSILKNSRLALFITKFAQFLHKLKWIDTFSVRYINYHFQSNEKRERLLNIWLLLSSFQVNQKNTFAFFAKTAIPISIFLSKKDMYITSEKILLFAQKSPAIQILEYDGGHRLDDKKLLSKLSVYSHFHTHRDR